MTRDYFNRDKRLQYMASPAFAVSNEYKIEKKVESITSNYIRIFLYIPRRIFAAIKKITKGLF